MRPDRFDLKSPFDWKWMSWKAYEHPERPSKLSREYYLNFFDDRAHVAHMIETKKAWLMQKELE